MLPDHKLIRKSFYCSRSAGHAAVKRKSPMNFSADRIRCPYKLPSPRPSSQRRYALPVNPRMPQWTTFAHANPLDQVSLALVGVT
jgi:hypothetical protein